MLRLHLSVSVPSLNGESTDSESAHLLFVISLFLNTFGQEGN